MCFADVVGIDNRRSRWPASLGVDALCPPLISVELKDCWATSLHQSHPFLPHNQSPTGRKKHNTHVAHGQSQLTKAYVLRSKLCSVQAGCQLVIINTDFLFALPPSWLSLSFCTCGVCVCCQQCHVPCCVFSACALYLHAGSLHRHTSTDIYAPTDYTHI